MNLIKDVTYLLNERLIDYALSLANNGINEIWNFFTNFHVKIVASNNIFNYNPDKLLSYYVVKKKIFVI